MSARKDREDAGAQEQFLIVTPEQLREGYKTYHHNQVPNIRLHSFKILELLPSGNYVVMNPGSGTK